MANKPASIADWQPLYSSELGEALSNAGVIPKDCRRVIIDIPAFAPILVHFETFAQPELLKIVAGEITGSTSQATIPVPNKPMAAARPKNCYGYDTFLEVPLPLGEIRKDIRSPVPGDRYLSVFKASVGEFLVDTCFIPFRADEVRIILGEARKKKRFATARFELEDGDREYSSFSNVKVRTDIGERTETVYWKSVEE